MNRRLRIILWVCLFLCLGIGSVVGAEEKRGKIYSPLIPNTSEKIEVHCTKVIDGQTFKAIYKGKEETVRLIGVKAPDKGEPFYEVTKKILQAGIENRDIELGFDSGKEERDKNGYLLAYLWCNSTFSDLLEYDLFLCENHYLIMMGYCIFDNGFTQNKYLEYFVRAEEYAKVHGYGVWARETLAESDYKVLKGKPSVFVGVSFGEQSKLDEEKTKRLIEAELKRYGIPVVQEGADIILSVALDLSRRKYTSGMETNNFFVTKTVSVFKRLYDVNNDQDVFAMIWEHGQYGGWDEDSMDEMEKKLRDVSDFINDYLKANPDLNDK